MFLCLDLGLLFLLEQSHPLPEYHLNYKKNILLTFNMSNLSKKHTFKAYFSYDRFDETEKLSTPVPFGRQN